MRKKICFIFSALVLMLGFSTEKGTAADSSAEVIVNLLLKKGVITQQEAAEVLGEMEEIQMEQAERIDKIPKKGTVVAGKYGKKHELSGYIQADAQFGDSVLRGPDNTFEIRRARLVLKGEIIDNLKYKLQIDASDSDDILRDAEISLTHFDWANFHVGQFKSPFGREELTPSTQIDTMERSEVTNAIVPARQIGAGLSGKLFDGFLKYAAGIYNGNGINTTNDDGSFLYVGRLVLTPFKEIIKDHLAKLEIGGNIGASGDSDVDLPLLGFSDFNGDRELYGLDGEFSWGPFSVKGEYLRAKLEFDGIAGRAADPTRFIAAVAPTPAADVDAQGYYITTSYFLIPERLQFATKWEEFDLDGGSDFDAFTLGLNYYFTPWGAKTKASRFMVNYVHGDREGSDEEDQILARLQVVY